MAGDEGNELDLIINGLLARAMRVVEAVSPGDRGDFLAALEQAVVDEIDRNVNRLYLESLREITLELLYRAVMARALELLQLQFPSQAGRPTPPDPNP